MAGTTTVFPCGYATRNTRFTCRAAVLWLDATATAAVYPATQVRTYTKKPGPDVRTSHGPPKSVTLHTRAGDKQLNPAGLSYTISREGPHHHTDSLNRREVLHTRVTGLKRVVKKEHADGTHAH
ncbi:hypothetical protein [Escherichia coli]|uniref:hypothetical protein n=1 Tax=Escherichia coli TaxID=562 RepID=UPI00259CAEC8|nr:hypothetical protein [Escherichia coli]MDM4883103.1 hypothetical protein [Escherichia coli]